MYIYESPNTDFQVFMGDDKYENEHLIKYGRDTDIWFHVDNYSSAHVYLRPKYNIHIEDIPKNIIEYCCQITKNNSIAATKEPSAYVVCTYWTNLLKIINQDYGSVSFKYKSLVTKFHINRDKGLIKAAEKTKRHIIYSEEMYAQEKKDYDHAQLLLKKKKLKDEKIKKKLEEGEARERYINKHYINLHTDRYDKVNELNKNMTIDDCREAEDDFM